MAARNSENRLRRPAESQLVDGVAAMRDELLDGFESRGAVLRWEQKLGVRTLGTVPTRRYRQIAREFVPDDHNSEGTLLAAFLTPDARTRDLTDDVARQLRERWASDVLAPACAASFRELRTSASEYNASDSDGVAGHDPAGQAFAMRPVLAELDEFQYEALDMALGGLEDKSEILEWGDTLTKATRGEPIDPKRGPGAFPAKCYREESVVRLLTDTSDEYQRAREAFLAKWLIPAFNRGVRDLTKKATEEPTEEETPDQPTKQA